MILPQQQFFIFPCVKRKESKERWEWRLNLSLNIYRNIYTVERGLRLLDFLFDICQNHWSVSQSAWSGCCCIEMAASHWRRNWSWSVKISCLVVFWVLFPFVCVIELHLSHSREKMLEWECLTKVIYNGSSWEKVPPPPHQKPLVLNWHVRRRRWPNAHREEKKKKV